MRCDGDGKGVGTSGKNGAVRCPPSAYHAYDMKVGFLPGTWDDTRYTRAHSPEGTHSTSRNTADLGFHFCFNEHPSVFHIGR